MHGEQGLRERKKEATRLALREAALRLALERGVDHVTVGAICAAVDVSQRTFFNYFSTKEECLVHVDVGAAEWIPDAVLRRPASEAPLTVVRAIVLELAARTEARKREVQLRARLVAEHPHLRAKHLAGYEVFERMLTEGLTTRPRPAPCDDLGLPVLAAVGLAVLRAELQRWCQEGGDSLPERVDRAFGTLERHVQAGTKERDRECR